MKKYSTPSEVAHFRSINLRQSPRKEIILQQQVQQGSERSFPPTLSGTPSTFQTQSSQSPSLFRPMTPEMYQGAQYRESLQNQLDLMKKLKQVVIELERVEEENKTLHRQNKRLEEKVAEFSKSQRGESRTDDILRHLKKLDGLYEKQKTKNHALIEDLQMCAVIRNRAYYEIQKMAEFISDFFEFLFSSAYPASKIGDCTPLMLEAEEQLNLIHTLYLEKLKAIGSSLPALNLAPQIAKVISAQWRKPKEKLHQQLYHSPIVSLPVEQTEAGMDYQNDERHFKKINHSHASSPPSSPPPAVTKKRRTKTCVVFATPCRSIAAFESPPIMEDPRDCSHCVMDDSFERRGQIQAFTKSNNKIDRLPPPAYRRQKQIHIPPNRIYSPSQNPPLSSSQRKQSPFNSDDINRFQKDSSQIGRQSLSHFNF